MARRRCRHHPPRRAPGRAARAEGLKALPAVELEGGRVANDVQHRREVLERAAVRARPEHGVRHLCGRWAGRRGGGDDRGQQAADAGGAMTGGSRRQAAGGDEGRG